MRQPDFDGFKEIFLNAVKECLGNGAIIDVETPWLEFGGEDLRRRILERVRDKVLDRHGVEFEVNRRLLSVKGPLESAIIQTYHEFNTVYLMERINDKIRAKNNQPLKIKTGPRQ
ncbi:MAG: hypothetical protein K6T80_04000 [Firmicutes bacterium]|nr:hypothetical protein [Bacillota bacterium]